MHTKTTCNTYNTAIQNIIIVKDNTYTIKIIAQDNLSEAYFDGKYLTIKINGTQNKLKMKQHADKNVLNKATKLLPKLLFVESTSQKQEN